MVRVKPPLSRLSTLINTPTNDVWRIHYEAVEKQSRGEDILLLSVGDPDFDTPDLITQHLVAQIRAGRTHYSPAAGEPALLQALADLESSVTGKDFTPNNFTVFPGATAALDALLRVLINPGDEVIVPDPMYIGYQGILVANLATVVRAPLDFSQSQALNVDEIAQRITPRTKVVLINTPGNPCGNMIDAPTLSTLAKLSIKHNFWLVCDEVYSLITFDAPHVSLLNCTDVLDNIAVVDGLSKSHAMSGWRVGWVATGERLAQALAQYSGSTFFGVSQFIQDAAVLALRTNDQHVEQMRAAYHARRDLVVSRINQIPQLGCIMPQAGMFVMLDVRAITHDAERFADLLLEHAGISTIPGNGFGSVTEGYLRIGLIYNLDRLDLAMDRLESALPSIQAAL